MNIYISMSKRGSTKLEYQVERLIRDLGHEVVRYMGDRVFLGQKIKNGEVDFVVFLPLSKKGKDYFGKGQLSEATDVNESKTPSLLAVLDDENVFFSSIKTVQVKDPNNFIYTSTVETEELLFDKGMFEEKLAELTNNPTKPFEIEYPEVNPGENIEPI